MPRLIAADDQSAAIRYRFQFRAANVSFQSKFIRPRIQLMNPAEKPVSPGRHSRNCAVCAHPEREEIENRFVAWQSPAAIAQDFGLADRSSVYRHAHAFGMFVKRQRNIRAALEKIIERAGEVDVTASAVVAAVQAYSKINAAGQWIDRSEQVSLNDLFERMTTQELEQYAQDGTLPKWFQASAVSATAEGSRK